MRQARATLTRYLELKKLGPTLEGALADFHTRFEDMTLTRYAEHQERTKLEADNSALIRLARTCQLDYILLLIYSIYSEVSQVFTCYEYLV